MTTDSGYTGRLRRSTSRSALECIQATGETQTRADELYRLSEIDRAHVVMLSKAGLIDHSRAATILAFISKARSNNFESLIDKPAPRGLYLLWEASLIVALGQDVAGSIHLARSRNDINATDARIRLREPGGRLMQEVMRLAVVLRFRAELFYDITMPMYTHFQAALPVSYGHYLAGILQSLLRTAERLLNCLQEATERCPLGAGAGGGTSISIDTAITAQLLGFSKPVRNSIDAVATRDFALRLLAELTVLGTLLSRLCIDLQLWSTSEFGFLDLPDELVGSSSMMPQKRNPYLLEHIQGQSARILGCFTASVTAVHAKPFSNNISANYEATLGLWEALNTSVNSTKLARLILRGAKPRPEEMRSRAEKAITEATELANRLYRRGHSFRNSHERVGAAITSAIGAGDAPIGDAVRSRIAAQEPEIDMDGLDPTSVMRASTFGGGPGRSDQWDAFHEEAAIMRKLTMEWKSLRRQWNAGASQLEREVRFLDVGLNGAAPLTKED